MAIFIPALASVPVQEKIRKYAAVSGGGTAMLEIILRTAVPEAVKLMEEPGISRAHRPAEVVTPEVSGEEVSVLKAMPVKAGTVSHPILHPPVIALVDAHRPASLLQAGAVVAQADAARSAVLPQPREQVEVEGVNNQKEKFNDNEAGAFFDGASIALFDSFFGLEQFSCGAGILRNGCSPESANHLWFCQIHGDGGQFDGHGCRSGCPQF